MKIYTFLMILIILAGCRDVKEVKTYEQLMTLRGKSIEIVTLDSSVYTTSNFIVNENSISFSGEKRKNYNSEKYKGEIPFSSITYIQTGDEELFTPLISAGVVITLIAVGSEVLEPTGANSTLIFPSSGSGSCPFVYSWNGKEYTLEGETFGISFGRSLESETAVVLESLQPQNGRIKVKFTNERPETHYFNTINAYAVQVDANTEIYSDNRNELKGVVNFRNLISAHDARGNDLTAKLLKEDGISWNCDLSSSDISNGYNDVVYATINTRNLTDSVSLLFTLKNTEISAVLFEYLRKELGSDFTSFTRAAETDSDLVIILRDKLNKSALKIDFWTGSAWEYADLIYPEANQTSFRKLVNIPLENNNSGSLRIRLRSLADVWKIDKLSSGSSSTPQLLNPELVYSSKDSQKLLNKDNQYIKLLPGEDITVEYKEIKNVTGKKTVYAIKAGGYLYEYIIRLGDENIAGLDMVNPDFAKLEMIKYLLKNEDLFLPIVYNKWMERIKQ